MQFNPLPVNGAYHIIIDKKQDERGSFARVFDSELLRKQDLHSDFPQHSISKNTSRGTLRGLHYQSEPYGEVKLINCLQGKIFDVIVDLRTDSPSYLKYCSVTLSGDDNSLVYVPSGCAHGFLTLADNSSIHYLISHPYVAEAQSGIVWNDPKLDITWPEEVKIISERDANLPKLENIER